MKKYKLIFMGTPEFAVPSLQKLIADPLFEILAVVTQPDKKSGRKQILTSSPIKKLAQQFNLKVLTPKSFKKEKIWEKRLKELHPDLIVVAAYGKILPQDILDIPKFGAINVHASLLPKLRGPAPIPAAILGNFKETGITIMKMDAGMDTGDILTQEKIEIASKETGKTLHDKLSRLGANLLVKTLPLYLEKKIKSHKQDDAKATYCKMIKKENGKINWSKSAEEIERMIRAYHPWPGTYTFWGNKRLRILAATPFHATGEKKNGEVWSDGKKIIVACGYDHLILDQVQLEGKKVVSGREFLSGFPKILGTILR